MLFFSSGLRVSWAFGGPGGACCATSPAVCRATRRATAAGVRSEPPPAGLSVEATGLPPPVSQPATLVTPVRPPCSGQVPTGSVPAM